MINFWKLAYESVKEQRDQYKAENDTLINELYTVGLSRDEAGDKIKELERENEKLKTQKIAFQRSYKQVYEENEKLEQIRDFKDSALKGADIKIKTLEQENEKYRIRAENAMELAERANCEVLRLERENEKLRSRLDEFLEHDYDNQKLYEEMKRDNRELKDKIERLK